MSRREPGTYSAVFAETIPSPARRSLAFAMAAVAMAAIAMGSFVSLAPLPTFLGLGGLALLTVLLFAMATLPLWQNLAIMLLAGFVILNYGFANWALLPGMPIPLGHVLLVAAVLLAIRGRARVVRAFLKEPAVVWWMVLVGLSFAHLVLEIPRHGVLAIRDASFVLEGLAMLLGFLWSKPVSRHPSVLAVLPLIFLLNALYALTFPVADVIRAYSPVSGVFQNVTLLGSYAHTSLFLVTGALYYFLVAKYIVRWPRGLIIGLAIFQFCWSFVFQSRSMYVGTAVALILLVILRGVRYGGRMAVVIVASLALFFLVIGVSGIVFQGRVGEVGADFLSRHVSSLFLDPNAPAEGSIEWRLDLLRPLWSRFKASPDVILIGEGFGEPLIEFKSAAGAVVRQPHNTHITVLLRLGTLGFALWLAMHWRMLLSLTRFRRHAQHESFERNLALWFFLFYVLAMLLTTVEPWLEFSYGAIPFYLIMGVVLRMSQESRGAASQLASPA